MSSSVRASSSSSRDDEKAAPSSREAKKITSSRLVSLSSISPSSSSSPPPPPKEEEEMWGKIRTHFLWQRWWRPLWRDGGVFPGGDGFVVLRSRALSTRPEGWIYQDEFRYVLLYLLCVHVRFRASLARTLCCVFSFPFVAIARTFDPS